MAVGLSDTIELMPHQLYVSPRCMALLILVLLRTDWAEISAVYRTWLVLVLH